MTANPALRLCVVSLRALTFRHGGYFQSVARSKVSSKGIKKLCCWPSQGRALYIYFNEETGDVNKAAFFHSSSPVQNASRLAFRHL